MAYDLRPKVASAGTALRGWDAIAGRVGAAWGGGRCLVVDCYPGVDVAAVEAALRRGRDGVLVLRTEDLLLPRGDLRRLLAPFLTDDRVFGRMAPLRMPEVFDPAAVAAARAAAEDRLGRGGAVLVIGPGARLVHRGDVLAYADMPRWEIQMRQRRGMPTWLAPEPQDDALARFKRGYFVEWRIADRWKMELFDEVDLFLDTTAPDDPRAVEGGVMRAALAAVPSRPFRVVPFFDPGPWGGQWMKRAFGLPPEAPNYAWGFDCVPEENSLLLDFAGTEVEVPSLNLVLRHPEPLLGPRVLSRFGPEFPIRFDFLDTVEGGNLSLQVHPDTGYARDRFGIAYTQDESYYILHAEPDAQVYLGLRDGVSGSDLVDALEAAQRGGGEPEVERFVNRLPAARHDHFSIPAGTVHCAGRGCLVLEISATPYIFTFKLWDWGRLGLDGRPRPIHADHGRRVLRDNRDAAWVAAEVLGAVEALGEGGGVKEERTGLHPLEFIETRRHWFTAPVTHDTGGGVQVLNLVQGERAVVESPDGAFAPFEVGFAETFIVPAAVGRYRIRPLGPGAPHATIRASVRP